VDLATHSPESFAESRFCLSSPFLLFGAVHESEPAKALWTREDIAMRIHSQLNIFFARVLIALATLTTVTAPAQVTGAGQSRRPAVVALPQDARESAQALHPALPGTGSAERVAASRSQKRTINSRATTPGCPYQEIRAH
jgi:hypothetical protein